MAKVLRQVLCAIAVFTLSFSLAGNSQVSGPTKKSPTHIPANTIGASGTGIFRGQRVNYLMVNGRMMFEGDIVLDHVTQSISQSSKGATIDYMQYRWPLVGKVYEIPYMIDPASGDVANINQAISNYNAELKGVIQWVPYTNQANYVDFLLNDASGSGEGYAYIGMVGGEQVIGGATNCTVSTILHEMGHTTGFWHEQMRPDRNNYVTVNFSNMISTTYSNSEIQYDDMQPQTLYDWSSVMHYFAETFSKDGSTVIESIPPGMPLSNTVGYSAGDLDAIRRLYQILPTKVTIATNPAGLQVVVDGATVTTPQSYSWPLYSTHTLSVGSDVQTQTGDIAGTTTSTTFYYTYGRWNDNGAQSHTITVLPGNNEIGSPASSPAVTVYMASFVELVPYTTSVYPTGAGTVAPSPAPQSYPGSSNVFYIARQPVTLTATPSAGQNFYQYIGSPYWVEGGLSVNPKNFLAPDTGNPINITTYFTPTSSPIYTIDSNPDGSNFYVIVDGSYWPAPTSFSPYYNSAWNVGSNHTITVDSPEYPWSSNTRYEFESWSDGGALSHSITALSTSTDYVATISPDYYLSDYANEDCAGTIGVTPPSPTGDGYYPGGTPVTFTATPDTGWLFTQWEQNLSGTANPLNVTMNDEITGIADFNTIATPLTLSSLSQVAAVADSAPFTLTINGTGFTSGSVAFVDNTFVANTYVNANEITVPITSTDLTMPGGIQVFVQNYPSGATCAAYSALPFNVAHRPIVTPVPLNVTFKSQLVSTTSPAATVSFKNSTNAAVTINSIIAIGNFAVASNTCGSSLAAAGTCSATVTFTPSAAGTISGSLSISDGAPDSPQVVALKGTGILPLTLAPASVSFGTVSVGTTTPAKTLTLTNSQSTAQAFSFTASGNYAINTTGTTCSGSLAANSSCKVAITFSPTTTGAINGSLTITNGTAYSPQVVQLSGTGSGGSTPSLTFTPATLSFANQVVGTTSAGKTVVVKNTSASALTLTSIAASGEFAVAGSGATPCAANLNLNAGASCAVSVTYAAPLGAASGTVSGAIIFTDNATVGQQALDVKGGAVLPLTLSPASLTFAMQAVATTSTAQTVTITNNTTASLSPTIAGNGDFAVVPGGATPCTGTLASHANCTFTVTFTPSAVGVRPGAVTVTDSANPGVQTVIVTGTGQ